MEAKLNNKNKNKNNNNLNHNIPNRKSIKINDKLTILSRKYYGDEKAVQNALSKHQTEWIDENQQRHNFIMQFGEFQGLSSDYKQALRQSREAMSKKLTIPTMDNPNPNNNYINEFRYFYENSQEKNAIKKFDNAFNAVKNSLSFNQVNRFENLNAELGNNINNIYGALINPYEAQLLFETTSLGYNGVVIPIKEAFATTISVASPLLAPRDLKDIKNYLINHNVVNSIRTALVDSYVFGGGVLTPILSIGGEPQYLSDLVEMERYFGVKNLKLDRLICFDRYCTIPAISNNGLFTLQLRSTMPVPLKTIFDNGVLQPDWYASFSPLTTSLAKLYRPDNFGVSIFARAGKAVYNYEQQLQFLNYALGQLSIIVFNSKTKPYESGGSADHTWDSKFGGDNIGAISSQLASMQNQMNVQRGLFLNDIEVSTLNRTFTGIGDIIKAMKEQASVAFNIRQDQLFGEHKTGLGSYVDHKATPVQTKYREQYREPITKILQWCVFCFFAERDFKKNTDDGFVTWGVNEFFDMLNNLELIYNDAVKTDDQIFKDYGISDIIRLVEAKILTTAEATKFIYEIPTIAKISDNDESMEARSKKISEVESLNLDALKQELKTQIAKQVDLENYYIKNKARIEDAVNPEDIPDEDFDTPEALDNKVESADSLETPRNVLHRGLRRISHEPQ